MLRFGTPMRSICSLFFPKDLALSLRLPSVNHSAPLYPSSSVSTVFCCPLTPKKMKDSQISDLGLAKPVVQHPVAMGENDFLISLLSGAAAGTSTDLSFFPIDTIKTRLQAKGGFFQNGGYRGIYRGLGSVVIASAPSASLFFVTYDTIKAKLAPVLTKQLNNESIAIPLTHMIAASCGEVAACLVRVPAEVIKQRTQTSKSNSSLDTFKSILRNESKEGVIRGFYRGWGTTILREVPFTVIQFPLYEWLKKRWSAKQGHPVNPLQGALCGSIAGGIAAALTTPLDVLKTRIMLNETRVSPIYLAKVILREEGFKVFWSGVGPRTMWISAGGAIFLGVYEASRAFLSSLKMTL